MRANALLAGLVSACCLLALAVSPASAEQRQADGLRLPKPENWCIAQETPLDCDLHDDCVWCEKPGNKFVTRCYPISAAKLVPKAWGLVCDKDLDPPAAAATAAAAEEDASLLAGSCDGKPEAACASPECVWCTSAAVGGGCYTPEEAQKLPKAIFKCKSPTAAARDGRMDAQ